MQNQTVQLAAGVTTYNLTTTALTTGPHNISIRVASSSSVSLANNSNTSIALPILIDTTAPLVSAKSFNYNAATQSITYTFNESVAGSVENTDVTLVNTITGIPIASGSIVGSVAPSTTARFTFPSFAFGALPDGQYTATLGAGLVTDLAGNALAANSVLNFFFIEGDANHDGAVDATDLGILSVNWQQSPRTFSQGDFTYNGVVNVDDLNQLALRWGMNILAVLSPAPPPSSSQAAVEHDDLLDLLA